MNNLNRSSGGQVSNYKKHGNARDYSLRMSRVADDKLLSNSVNSVHDFSGVSKKQGDMGMHELSMQHPGAHHGHHNHSKSLMKGPTDDLALIDKKKEILDKKRYE